MRRLQSTSSQWSVPAVMLVILGVIACLYWPSRLGGFVWDDVSSIYEEASLRGDAWKHSMLQGFNGWVNYFRPLVVLLFVAETRAFDFAPGPMHIVSLAIHLADTLLVGLLAINLATRVQAQLSRTLIAAVSMAFYGLHPALIEPVDWVGCQFELAVIFFMLAGLLLNLRIQSPHWRAIAVAMCFVLAAGFKEAAACFPLLLILLDLLVAQADAETNLISAIWRRQRFVYVAVVIAGITYLGVRYASLGFILSTSGVGTSTESLLTAERLHQVCMTYLSYWRLVLWPMSAISPIHPFDATQFAHASLRVVAIDLAAIALLSVGVVAFLRREPLGIFILSVSAALLPVVNLVPISLSESLYHDRYATTAVAMACVLLPIVLGSFFTRSRARALKPALVLVALVWLGFAMANARVTVPLWGDEVTLWQWTLRQHPGSMHAKDLLLSAYMHRSDIAHARALADELLEQRTPCLACMLNVANLAIVDSDAERATHALNIIDQNNLVLGDLRYLPRYILTQGRLRELQGNLIEAESAYRDAIQADPLDPEEHMALALVLARQGKTGAAHAAMETTLPMFAPDQRERRRQLFERVLATSGGGRVP